VASKKNKLYFHLCGEYTGRMKEMLKRNHVMLSCENEMCSRAQNCQRTLLFCYIISRTTALTFEKWYFQLYGEYTGRVEEMSKRDHVTLSCEN